MKLWAVGSVLSLAPAPTEAYFFDRSGRLFAAWEEGWFIRLGLSGRGSARRWKGGRRDIRALAPEELRRLEMNSHATLEKALSQAGDNEKRWIELALGHDPAQDTLHFRTVYRPIGILPPDQYGACVVQITEGCGWNQCHFCSFYRRQNYRHKERGEIKSHIDGISAYFGEGLSLRRSIFLGEANAMGAPLDLLVYGMETAAKTLIPRMPQFRGFYSFHEGTEGSRHSTGDFRVLAGLGLKRVYYGLETGQPGLRERLNKPGPLGSVAESIENAKAGGVRVGLIVLAGAGGTAWAKRHTEETIRFIGRLPLDSSDIIFLSPLYGPDGTSEPALTASQMEGQMRDLRRGLEDKALVAPYDIREFVY